LSLKETAGGISQVGERQVERDREGEISQKRHDANQLQKVVAAVDQPDQHQTPEEACNDVERGKRHRLHRAAKQAAKVGLGEEAAVDHDLDDEQDRKNAGLQDHLAGTCQPRRALDAVVLAKQFALDLGLVEAAAQDEEFVAADGGFGAKVANRFRCGLLDGGKALLEGECVHPLVIGVKMFEIDDVRILFVGLDALDHLVLDVVHGLGVGRGAAFRAAFAAECGQPQFVGHAIDVEVEKDGGCRAIMVGGLAQQGPDARDRGRAGSGETHDVFSLLVTGVTA
jgi:hypothetical protein